MAINTHNIIRGGKSSALTIGIEQGQTVLFERPEELQGGQQVHEGPYEMRIRFNPMNGNVLSVNTEWHRFVLNNNGEQFGVAIPLGMTSNTSDTADFIRDLGPFVLPRMENGKKRKIDGYNYLPVFNAAGQVIAYTEEQLQQGPSNNYDTHNADGTPINPLLEENETE